MHRRSIEEAYESIWRICNKEMGDDVDCLSFLNDLRKWFIEGVREGRVKGGVRWWDDGWRSWREGIWLVILCSTCSSSFWVRWRRLLWKCLLSLCCDWLSREWSTLLTSGVRFLVSFSTTCLSETDFLSCHVDYTVDFISICVEATSFCYVAVKNRSEITVGVWSGNGAAVPVLPQTHYFFISLSWYDDCHRSDCFCVRSLCLPHRGVQRVSFSSLTSSPVLPFLFLRELEEYLRRRRVLSSWRSFLLWWRRCSWPVPRHLPMPAFWESSLP